MVEETTRARSSEHESLGFERKKCIHLHLPSASSKGACEHFEVCVRRAPAGTDEAGSHFISGPQHTHRSGGEGEIVQVNGSPLSQWSSASTDGPANQIHPKLFELQLTEPITTIKWRRTKLTLKQQNQLSRNHEKSAGTAHQLRVSQLPSRSHGIVASRGPPILEETSRAFHGSPSTDIVAESIVSRTDTSSFHQPVPSRLLAEASYTPRCYTSAHQPPQAAAATVTTTTTSGAAAERPAAGAAAAAASVKVAAAAPTGTVPVWPCPYSLSVMIGTALLRSSGSQCSARLVIRPAPTRTS